PLTAKAGRAALTRRETGTDSQARIMPATYDYDLVVIGSGPAGEKGAAQAAYFGKRVALVERSRHLGGAGVNTGTVPSKTLRETALCDSILHMQRIPRTMAVVGGGVIGCEYATMFRALGVEVTIVGGQDRLLPFLDREIADRLRLQIELLGVRVRVDVNVDEVRLDAPDVVLHLRGGEDLPAECVLF